MNPSPDGYGHYVTVDDIHKTHVDRLRKQLAEKHPHILANGHEVIRQKRAADKVYNEFLALLIKEYNENDLSDLLRILEDNKPPPPKPAPVQAPVAVGKPARR